MAWLAERWRSKMPIDEPADEVDHRDDDGRDGITADELGRPVHGAVEVGLVGDLLAPAARLVLVDAPEARSASIAICFPGIPSRVKRAATSATRPDPEVITTNWMMIRMRKTTSPTTIARR
jgi:hypothetical protein